MESQCPDDELMAAYLDGVVADERRATLESHISGCDICIDTITNGNRLIRGGAVEESDPVPDDVTLSAIDITQRHGNRAQHDLVRRFKRSARSMFERLSDAVSRSPAVRPIGSPYGGRFTDSEMIGFS